MSTQSSSVGGAVAQQVAFPLHSSWLQITFCARSLHARVGFLLVLWLPPAI